MPRIFILIAAISGLLSVMIGAFAAHGFKQILSVDALRTVQIAAQYQMYHALALLAVGVYANNRPMQKGLKAAGLGFILGAILFSGSLYALALGAPRWLGPITPLGGLCFMWGWASLILGHWRANT